MHRKLKSMEKFYQRKEKGIGLENAVFVAKREDVHGLTARTIVGSIICKWLGMERFWSIRFSIGTSILTTWRRDIVNV